MIRLVSITAVVVALVAVGVAGLADAQTAIVGTVKNKAGQPLSGFALLEKGKIHNNVWDRGGLVENGRFRIELPEGGSYGLHVYSSGYIYAPQAVRVRTGSPLEITVVMAPEPTRANDPIIRRAEFVPADAGKPAVIKLDVTDPQNDLGPQVMAFDAQSRRVHAMEPPQKVPNLKANYPNGVYTLQITATEPLNPKDWYFVVADHQCNTTDILSFPHEPKPPQVIKP